MEGSKSTSTMYKPSTYFDGQKEQERPPWEIHLNLVLPKLIGYLEFTDILKVRLVSKTWLLHADELFSEGNPLLRPYKSDLYLSSLHHRLPSTFLHQKQSHFGKIMEHYQFRRSVQLTGFTRNMVSQLKCKRNPFFGRYVSVGLINSNIEQDPKLLFRNVPEYWINVEKFIRHWGRNIWYLQLGDDGHTHTAVEFYHLLHKLLESLPNLKQLDIISLRLHPIRKSPETLENAIKENSLPTLANLESILLPSSGKLHEQIQHALIRTYARQLRNLRFDLASCATDYPHVVTMLGELTVFHVVSNEKLTHTLDLFTIPLKKLVLDLRDNPKVSSWSVERVLGLLQGFQVEVAVLKLSPSASLQENKATSCIPIRNKFKATALHTLEMNHCVGTSYNFLWCLPGLKNLHIEFNPYVDGDLKGNLVKFLVGTGSGTLVKEEDQEVDIRDLIEAAGDLYTSNIWHVVPSLEVLTYTKLHWCWWPSRTVYRKELYEWQKSQKLRGGRKRKVQIRVRRKQFDENQNRVKAVSSEENTISASLREINMRRL